MNPMCKICITHPQNAAQFILQTKTPWGANPKLRHMPVIHETLPGRCFRGGAHYTEVILPVKRPVVKHISQKRLSFSVIFRKEYPKIGEWKAGRRGEAEMNPKNFINPENIKQNRAFCKEKIYKDQK